MRPQTVHNALFRKLKTTMWR